ncbi:hypothetical protein Alsa2_CDS0161 [Staphylococcus phage Alsa_2]|nr:hypothetical protein Alsa2_CDS0161 [Staphylococcus phage Alsa_2]
MVDRSIEYGQCGSYMSEPTLTYKANKQATYCTL